MVSLIRGFIHCRRDYSPGRGNWGGGGGGALVFVWDGAEDWALGYNMIL